MDLFLGRVDYVLIFARQVNLVFASSMCTRGNISIDARKRRWEIDGSVGGSFDLTNVLTKSSADDVMQGAFQFHSIDLTLELKAICQ